MKQSLLSRDLFQAPPRLARSSQAVVLSILLHCGIVAAAVVLTRDAVAAALPRAARVLTFVNAVPAPDPVLIVPSAAPAPQERPQRAEPIAAFVEPVPEPESEETRIEPKPPVPAPRPEPVKPAMAPPKVAPPAVTIGMFAATTPSARTTQPERSIESAGFDAPAARAPELKSAPAVTGVFGSSGASNPRPGSDRVITVAAAGFGPMNTASLPAPAPRVIADAGFGSVPTAAPTRAAAPSHVRDAGFDAAPPVAAAPAPRPRQIDVPVEILAKPTPVYTNEARAMKIEGEVLLEVEFSAKAEIRVLRVVRGLGHGLDEAATRAALGIRFKPAQSSGQTVDYRSIVHIVFRLA